MSDNLLLALDAGTSAVKALLVSIGSSLPQLVLYPIVDLAALGRQDQFFSYFGGHFGRLWGV